MSRPAKGARLYPQAARKDKEGRVIDRAQFVIRDGSTKRRTGFGLSERREAEKALADYIAEKYRPGRERDRDPAQIPVSDVISIYLTDKAPKHANPEDTARRAVFLISFFGDYMLGELNGDLCRKYAAQRSTPAAARRDLEDLRSAINHHRREGYHRELIEITLPPANAPREDFLSRDEAAALIWAAYRYREIQKGKRTDRASRKHIARFSLVAVYTGTRAGSICGARIDEREDGRGFIDLEAGVFYRAPRNALQTKKRRPPVRLPDRLLGHLRRWYAPAKRENDKRVAAGEAKKPVYAVEFGGKPVRRIERAFKRAVIDAGLDPDRITPHTWRHTAATWLMQNGADLWEAAGFLGMTVELLERRYGHHHPDHQAGARNAITRAPGQKPDRLTRTKQDQSVRADAKNVGNLRAV